MAFTERRGKNSWRVHYKRPDGTWDKTSKDEYDRPFASEQAAKDWGIAQEVDIKRGVWRDPELGKLTLQDWVDQWWPAQDLALKTRRNYAYSIKKHILPFFGGRTLSSLTPIEIAQWERSIVAAGYAVNVANGARARLISILGDAVAEGLIASNPALRPRKRGRKTKVAGRSREKVWATPRQVLLLAEREAVLSDRDDEFYAVVTLAYTAMRWGELTGLDRDHVRLGSIRVDWQLVEDRGRFYRLPPKDASHRTLDVPPFLAALISEWVQLHPDQKCECAGGPPADGGEKPCQGGMPYMWLGQGAPRRGEDGKIAIERGHIRASNHDRRLWSPAVDGRYAGSRGRPGRRVLVDVRETPWPGRVLPPWPAAERGKTFVPPRGRGFWGYDIQRQHVYSWLPLLPGLTPHGLRHSHQTWMAEDRIDEKLRDERMGHASEGMRAHYTHISEGMRQQLKDALQARWERSLAERAAISLHSPVPALERLLKPYRDGTKKVHIPSVSQMIKSPLRMISEKGL
ncbi:tyrosine-type recombinase/integrase [Nonomuraea sp. 10N515B]|uniref:tyrosine-type recombinase/integrase n=1 Tax=Nonomuraea sp. 10N515B TaxID=3457422 RepID=UPI003FCD20DF